MNYDQKARDSFKEHLLMKEIIIRLEDYQNYELSSNGYIRNIVTNKTLNLNHNYVVLTKHEDGEVITKCFNLARLFAETFIPNSQNFPTARVIDENYTPKYSIENIKWCFKSEDLTGRLIGMLTINKLKSLDGKPFYDCTCYCSNIVVRQQEYFTNRSRTKSCGCLINAPRKHGRCYEVTYARWAAMKTRATNPNFSRADCYFEKGIGMCPSWGDFRVFLEDMGECPSKKHSLDRIDNSGDYCKENCRWTTQDVQTFNKISANEKSGKITGVHLHKSGCWDVRWRQDGKEGSRRFKEFIEAVAFRREKELEIYGMTKINTESLDITAYY